MLMLVSGATTTVRQYPQVGVLVVPAARNDPAALALRPGCWAMDNGAYAGFDAAAFVQMLETFHGQRGCRFVTAPDVVADAHATLSRWPFWAQLLRGLGWVPALVLQDGMTPADVPWREIGAVFVGGSTEWKLGPQAQQLASYAKARGLWVHVGRVNSRRRIAIATALGGDSFDGSGYSMFPDTHIPNGVRDAAFAAQQARLDL
jgi:hypothetical protein